MRFRTNEYKTDGLSEMGADVPISGKMLFPFYLIFLNSNGFLPYFSLNTFLKKLSFS